MGTSVADETSDNTRRATHYRRKRTTMADRNYDIVVFGATGFTGQYVVEYVAKAAQDAENEGGVLKWAVAGRNAAKLGKVLDQASLNTGMVLKDKDCLVCDVSDDSSLDAMAAQTRLLLNCVGPYRFSGEQVVASCLRTRTHHIDISGEPQFLEKMQLKYHEEAKEKGVYIVGACGFDSVPSDVGRQLVHKEMNGPVNQIEMYLKAGNDGPIKGPGINYGTYESAVYGVGHSEELRKLRKQLFPEKLPQILPKSEKRGLLHKSKIVDAWCMIFPGADHSVMQRSERARFYEDNARPSKVHAYVQVPNFFMALLLSVGFLIFGFMTQFSITRSLLLKFPWLFTFGAVTKEGPSEETIKKSFFEMTLIGKGWKNREESLEIDEPMDREVKVVVKGKNVGYGATCEMMVQSAIVTLNETDKLPSTGGVLTPGFAYAKTTLVDRLHHRGVTFDTIITDDI